MCFALGSCGCVCSVGAWVYVRCAWVLKPECHGATHLTWHRGLLHLTWHRGLLLWGHFRAGFLFGGLSCLVRVWAVDGVLLKRDVAVPYLGSAADAPLLAAAPRGGCTPGIACLWLGRLLLACVGRVSSFSAESLQPWHASGCTTGHQVCGTSV